MWGDGAMVKIVLAVVVVGGSVALFSRFGGKATDKIRRKVGYLFSKRSPPIGPLGGWVASAPKPETVKNGGTTFDEEFGEVAQSFEFLYEDSFSAVSTGASAEPSEIRSLLVEWEQKIRAKARPKVMSRWRELVKKHCKGSWVEACPACTERQQTLLLSEWMEILRALGLARGQDMSFVAEDESVHAYFLLDAGYEVGDRVIVVKPYWSLDGRCVERGRARIEPRSSNSGESMRI